MANTPMIGKKTYPLKFKLDDEDMKKIATLNKNKKYNQQTPEKLEVYANRFPVYEKE